MTNRRKTCDPCGCAPNLALFPWGRSGDRLHLCSRCITNAAQWGSV